MRRGFVSGPGVMRIKLISDDFAGLSMTRRTEEIATIFRAAQKKFVKFAVLISATLLAKH